MGERAEVNERSGIVGGERSFKAAAVAVGGGGLHGVVYVARHVETHVRLEVQARQGGRGGGREGGMRRVEGMSGWEEETEGQKMMEQGG